MSHGPQQPLMGTVRVNVRRASNIKDVDRIGKSDPFVQVMIGPERHKTSVEKNTLDPEWNEEKTLRVPLRQSTHHGHLFPRDQIVLEMYDAQTVGKPRPLGKAVIQLRDYRYTETRQEIRPMDGNGNLFVDVTAVDWGIGGPTPGFPEGQMHGGRRHKHRHSSPPPRPPGYGAGHLSPQRHTPLGGPQYSYLGPHTALGQMPPPPSPSRANSNPQQVYPPSNIFPTVPLSPPPGSPPPQPQYSTPPPTTPPGAPAYPYGTMPIPAVAPQPQPQHPYVPPQGWQQPPPVPPPQGTGYAPPPPPQGTPPPIIVPPANNGPPPPPQQQAPPIQVPPGSWGPPPTPPSEVLPPPPPTFTGPVNPGPNANFAPALSAMPSQHRHSASPPRPMSPAHFHPHAQRPPTPPTPPPGAMPPPPAPIVVPGPNGPPPPPPCGPGCGPPPPPPCGPPPPPCPCPPLQHDMMMRHSPPRSHRSHRSSPSPRSRTSDQTLPHIIGPEDELQALKIQHMELANATRETRLIIERKEAEINMEKEALRIAEKERMTKVTMDQEHARFAEKERLQQERFMLEQRLKELTEQERALGSPPQAHVPRRSPPSPHNRHHMGPPTPTRNHSNNNNNVSLQTETFSMKVSGGGGGASTRPSNPRNNNAASSSTSTVASTSAENAATADASVFANQQLHQLAMENAQLEKDNEQERRRLDHLAATLAEQERRLDELDRELHTPTRGGGGSGSGPQSPQYQQTTTTVETYRYGSGSGSGGSGQVPRQQQNTLSPSSNSRENRTSQSPPYHPAQYASPPRLVESEQYSYNANKI